MKESERLQRELHRAGARGWALLAVGGVVVLGLGALVSRGMRTPVGEPCREDEQCRSRMCIPGVDLEALDLDLRLLEHEGMGSTKYLDQGILPPSWPGTCTEACETDADCPPEMSCGEGASQVTLNGFRAPGAGWSSVRLCLPSDYADLDLPR